MVDRLSAVGLRRIPRQHDQNSPKGDKAARWLGVVSARLDVELSVLAALAESHRERAK